MYRASRVSKTAVIVGSACRAKVVGSRSDCHPSSVVFCYQNTSQEKILGEYAMNTRRLSFEKKLFFCVGEYVEYGFDQQRLIWYVCRLWDMVFS